MKACVRAARRRDDAPGFAQMDRFAAVLSRSGDSVASLTKAAAFVSSRALPRSAARPSKQPPITRAGLALAGVFDGAAIIVDIPLDQIAVRIEHDMGRALIQRDGHCVLRFIDLDRFQSHRE